MGRRKQRTREVEEEVKRPARRLEEPWPASPTRPPKYVLYCTNYESDRQYVVNTCALYAVKKLYEAIVGDNEVEPSPLEPKRTMTFGDIDLRCEEMQEILAHKYTAAEEEWELPAPYPDQIERFLHGPRMSRSLEGESKPAGDKPVREKREAKPKIDRSQFITVQSLAEEIGIDPRDARAALRKAKVEKPAGGWLGDEAWAKGIRDVLKKAKAELKGKK